MSMKSLHAITFCTSLIVLQGCGGKKENFDSFLGPQKMERLRSGDESSYSEMKLDFAVRQKDASFKSVWKKLFGGTAPETDLNGKAVLFALYGQQQSTSHQIRIRGAEIKGDTMEIKVKLYKGDGVKSQCSPHDVVLVETAENVTSYKFINADTGELLEDSKAY